MNLQVRPLRRSKIRRCSADAPSVLNNDDAPDINVIAKLDPAPLKLDRHEGCALVRSVIFSAKKRYVGMSAMFDAVTEGIKKWLVSLFASAINRTTRPEDRKLAIEWLSQSRDVVASDLRSIDKFKKLSGLINSRKTIATIANSVSESVSNYRNQISRFR